jgi:hypothetical protein
LTGSAKAVRLTVNRRAKGLIDHPGWMFLVDPECMLRYRYLGSILEVGFAHPEREGSPFC